jgi:glycine amidinotransferase
MSVGNTLIKACFAWPCRSREIEIAYSPIVDVISQDSRVHVVRRPESSFDNILLDKDKDDTSPWAINNNRPAFDTADFMRFGKTILGQYSPVTNKAGVEYIQQHLPDGYKIEIIDIDDPSAMHIDATILPLHEGLLVYNPTKVTEVTLRQHAVLASWDLRAYPFTPEPPVEPPLYMTSPWLCLNALVLDGKRVIVEASDHRTAQWYESLGMQCIPCPFKHVNSIGGSFHCATVDLVRENDGIDCY